MKSECVNLKSGQWDVIFSKWVEIFKFDKVEACPSHSSQPEILGQGTLELDVWSGAGEERAFSSSMSLRVTF